MKRYVLLAGGSGARVAEAMLCAACAGVFQADSLELLLADPDRRGVRSADLLRAKYADYARMQATVAPDAAGAVCPFHTQMRFHAWPQQLPHGAQTLSGWVAQSETDELLCQALFDAEAMKLDLHQGFHGRQELAQVAFAGMLEEAAQSPADPLNQLVSEMRAALEMGEEVRVVLAGSVCGGTGAAGLALLARYVREQTGGHARIGAILLAASGDHEDPAGARDAIARFAKETSCDAVCVLGLPRSSCSDAPADYAHLTDWLAVYSMDVLLHRPQWPSGLFTVKAPEGPLSWEIFGKAANRYRLAYGSLVKAAAAWSYVLAPKVDKRLRHPMFLRDNLFGWYAHFFRNASGERQRYPEDAAALTRLMNVVLLWLGGLLRTLPPEMCHAAEMAQASAEAQEHYTALTSLIAQLTTLDEDAQKDEQYEQSFVHRHDSGEGSGQTLRRIDAVKAEIARRSATQENLNRHIGGAAAIDMLRDALEAAEAEDAELDARYEEATRRIDHAERIAAPQDQYRITDARTKLQRMERHRQALQARTARIREDAAAASMPERRYAKPMTMYAAQTDWMFTHLLTGRLLTQQRLTRREVESMWGMIVLPQDGVSLKQTLKAIKRAQVNHDAPVMSLMYALMIYAMGEV